MSVKTTCQFRKDIIVDLFLLSNCDSSSYNLTEMIVSLNKWKMSFKKTKGKLVINKKRIFFTGTFLVIGLTRILTHNLMIIRRTA